jgi:hypothetical protein
MPGTGEWAGSLPGAMTGMPRGELANGAHWNI